MVGYERAEYSHLDQLHQETLIKKFICLKSTLPRLKNGVISYLIHSYVISIFVNSIITCNSSQQYY